MKRILLAGIGNIFFGDDAFGCEVARALAQRAWPAGVTVKDFGIRSYDLAYALMDGCDAAILIDAMPGRAKAGTLFVVEPDVSGMDEPAACADAHGMNPVRVLQLVRSLGGQPPQLYLVGCVPEVLEREDGGMGLSEAVHAAIPGAVAAVEELVSRLSEHSAFPESTLAGLLSR